MNNDWEHFGEEIKQTIQDAIDTKDYSRLNQMVSDTVNHAMDCVSAGIKNGGWYRDPKTGQPLYGNKKIRCRKPEVSSESRIEDVGNEKL